MRQFIAQFKLTGRQWLALACVAGMVGLIAWLSLRQQTLEYQRRLDASSLRTIQRIEAAIQKAEDERKALAKSVDELKKDVKEIAP